MTVQANITSQQPVIASITDDKITAVVSGGIGPKGEDGAAGVASINGLSGVVTIACVGATIATAGQTITITAAQSWNDLTDKPATFAPSAHTHVAANITDFTAAVIAAAPPTTNASLLTSGTLADARLSANVVFTTDARLSDAREWSAATVTQAQAEAGTDTTRRAFTVLRVWQAIAAWWAASSAKTKLDGIATGATANQTDAHLLSRANHTGTQTASTISDFNTAVVAAAPPTTNASLLTSGTVADARLSANVPLLVGGYIPSAYLPSFVDDVLEYANLAGFPATGETGKIYVARDTNKAFRWSGSAYVEISASPGSTDAVPEGSVNLYFTNARSSSAAPVQSVAGRTGSITLAKADVGLGNVDNTADASKPVSTDQAAADAAVQAYAIQRANHTGTQAAGTITGLAAVATSGSASDLGSGTLPAARLPATTVTAGSYGSASSVATFTVDSAGRLTAAGSTTIAIAAAAVSGLGSLATQSAIGNISSAGAIGSTSGLPIITTTSGVLTVGAFGTTAGTFAQGNDPRLSDSRAPTGAAGGDLTGTYPNPTIAPGAVITADLADGAVTLAKTTGIQKTISSGTAAPSGGSSGDIYLRYSP